MRDGGLKTRKGNDRPGHQFEELEELEVEVEQLEGEEVSAELAMLLVERVAHLVVEAYHKHQEEVGQV